MSRTFYVKPIIFLLNAAIILFLLSLLLPFLAAPIYNISSMLFINIYMDHLQLYWIVSSLLLAVPISYIVFKKKLSLPKQTKLIAVQFLFLICLVAIAYFTLDAFNEIMYRPLYN